MLTKSEFEKLKLGVFKIIENRIYDKIFVKYILKINFDEIKRYLFPLLPKGFKWIINYIEIKPIRIHNKKEIYNLFFKPSINIEFSLLENKKTFRYLPTYLNLAITKDGELFNILTNNILKINPKIKHLSGYPYFNINKKSILVHRLVALAWVENDDYIEKYIVDHLDNDKTNFKSENLKWVTQSLNINKNKNISWMLYSKKNKKFYNFDSLGDLAIFIKIDKKTLSNKGFPQIRKLQNGDIVIIENTKTFSNWKLLKEIDLFDFKYKVITEKKEKIFFKTIKDIETFFLINKKFNSFYKLKRYLKNKNILLLKTFTNKQNKYRMIYAKNLIDDSILKDTTVKKISEKIMCSKSALFKRLTGNKNYGVPIITKNGNWLIKTDLDTFWPKIKQNEGKIKQKIKIILNKKEFLFKSIREASRELNISRKTISKKIKKENNNINNSDFKIAILE